MYRELQHVNVRTLLVPIAIGSARSDIKYVRLKFWIFFSVSHASVVNVLLLVPIDIGSASDSKI
jgi:hypothetical protein